MQPECEESPTKEELQPLPVSLDDFKKSIDMFDARGVVASLVCSLCHRILSQTRMIKMCLCRFCGPCIEEALASGISTCPNPNCPTPNKNIREGESCEITVSDPLFDGRISLLQLEPKTPVFVRPRRYSESDDEELGEEEEFEKGGFLPAPDLTVSRISGSSDSYSNSPPIDLNDSEQPKNHFDYENPLLKAARDGFQHGPHLCNAIPKYKMSDFALTRCRMQENMPQKRKPTQEEWIMLTGIASKPKLFKSDVIDEFLNVKREESEEEKLEIDTCTSAGSSAFSDMPNLDDSGEASEEVIDGCDNDPPIASSPSLVENNYRSHLEETSSRPLILWPDMNITTDLVEKDECIVHFLYIQDSTKVSFLKKFVLDKLVVDNELECLEGMLQVDIIPVLEELPVNDVKVLQRIEKTEEVRTESGTMNTNHAVSLEVENPDLSTFIIFDYPVTPISETATIGEIRDRYWANKSAPLKVVYKISEIPGIIKPELESDGDDEDEDSDSSMPPLLMEEI